MNYKKTKIAIATSVIIVGLVSTIQLTKSPTNNNNKRNFDNIGLHVEDLEERAKLSEIECAFYFQPLYGYMSICTRYDKDRIYVSFDYKRDRQYNTSHIQYKSHITQRNENGEYENIGYRTGIVSDNPDPKLGRSNFDIKNITNDGDVILEFELYGVHIYQNENKIIKSVKISH